MTISHLTSRFASSAGEIAWGSVGAGPDVVLVHGTPTNATIWDGVIGRLNDTYRFHVFDLPGYGRSERHEGQDVRLRSFATTVAELVGHLEIERPVLVGHDVGAASVLGAHLVENLDAIGIVVADVVVLNPWGTAFSLHVKRHEDVFAAIPGYVHRAMLAAHLDTAVSRPMTGEIAHKLMAPWLGDAGQAAYYRQVAAYDHEFTERLEPLYPDIAVPMLVLWGEEDRWVDLSVGRRLAGLVRTSRLETLPDAGHFAMLDTPGLFSAKLDAWLHTVTGDR